MRNLLRGDTIAPVGTHRGIFQHPGKVLAMSVARWSSKTMKKFHCIDKISGLSPELFINATLGCASAAAPAATHAQV